MIKNKKADDFAWSNLVGAIIAIIAIILITVFLFDKIKTYQQNQETESARSLLNIIESRINALEEGKTINITLQSISSKEKWYLAGFNPDEDPPDKCFFQSCICICKDFVDTALKEITYPQQCQNAGFCRQLDKKIEVSSKVKRTQYTFLEKEVYIYGGKYIEVTATTPLIDIKVNKTLEKIILSRNYEEIIE